MNNHLDLSFFPFFSDISAERLAEIEAFSMLKTYKKNDVVFQCDESAQNLFGLVQGNIELTLLFNEKIITKDIKYEDYISTNIEILEKPVVIETVLDRNIFGWSALVEPRKMTATAKCVSDCDIAIIPAFDLIKLFNKDPELGYLLNSRINVLIAQRLDSRTKKLVDTWCSLFDIETISSI
ncbi:MAG: cyclic nucleotide-binding domain-containing protein [Desulfobacteraceae bacterium]|nr:cyclic nucleotide-binding domain-containing protein [Desulfobacteraceae bacterium]